MLASDATQRFSSRVDNYARHRPGYPQEVIELLERECNLGQRSVVADVASGTGIFTRLLLQTGCKVFGVEPNPEMRNAGELFLSQFPNLTSVNGTAEATTLPSHSIDIVTAAQAAHWFDKSKARLEFDRILKPGGWIVLVWNERRKDSTDFLREYENLVLKYGTDYQEIRHERTTDSIETFFAPSPFARKQFEYIQTFDYAGLEGRLLSSSYTPQEGHKNYQSMLRELRCIFEAYQKNGTVSFDYDTQVFYATFD